MADVSRAFEVGKNGILIEKADGTDGVWFGGGDAVPTHSATIGSIYLRTNGDWYKQKGPGATDWAIFVEGDNTQFAKLNQGQFFGIGAVGDDYLSLGASSKSSDIVPLPIFHDVELVGFSWSNDDATFSVDIEIYKNGLDPGDLIKTITVTNKKTISDSSMTPISLSHGDRVTVFLKKNTTKATDPVVTLFFQVTTETSSEVST